VYSAIKSVKRKFWCEGTDLIWSDRLLVRNITHDPGRSRHSGSPSLCELSNLCFAFGQSFAARHSDLVGTVMNSENLSPPLHSLRAVAFNSVGKGPTLFLQLLVLFKLHAFLGHHSDAVPVQAACIAVE